MTGGKEMLELILRRQSDRKYSNRPIEEEKLSRIIDAGRMAPSACNAQPWKFIVVNDRDIIKKLAEVSTSKVIEINKFVGSAPVIIVLVRESPNISSRIGGAIHNRDYSHNDLGISAAHICLQAAAEGIGSCILGWYDERKIRKILEIPSSKRVELVITLGYSESEYREKKRKPKDTTVSYNKY